MNRSIAWIPFVLTTAVFGQSSPAFDAASVKTLENRQGAAHFTVSPTRLDVKNMTLAYLIQRAFNLRDDQVSGPDWIRSRGYDVVATTSAPAPRATMMTMLRSLLIDRFQLATHFDAPTKSTYRLVATGLR